MPPFTVLHVCLGNICRSPMAERLLALAVTQRLGKLDPDADPDDLLRSVSAGMGGWHAGEEMNPPAARQLRLRGGNTDGFAARKLSAPHLAEAGLILTATGEQVGLVGDLLPDAAGRTFVLGHFGRLVRQMDLAALPPAGTEPDVFAARAAAVVAAANQLRVKVEPLPTDDVDDPWGRGDQTFQRVADEIDDTMALLVAALLPGPEAA
ncbi:phosphotyrosine protein phosphatase [Actinoplanes sp. NPDC051859]|uniref:arsenate reductase/protein-tyrosine-phosphatase family protein n=1 Tax=Actinoplanes sp. NPDC051859 TaxID=3363909 RepID=UPI00378806F7